MRLFHNGIIELGGQKMPFDLTTSSSHVEMGSTPKIRLAGVNNPRTLYLPLFRPVGGNAEYPFPQSLLETAPLGQCGAVSLSGTLLGIVIVNIHKDPLIPL